jgi:hypothetical protein
VADELLEVYKESRANPKKYPIEFYKPIYEKYKKYR